MDNQQNQSGTPMPGDDIRTQNAGSTSGNPGASRTGASSSDSTASGAAASSRKSAPTPNAQGGAGATGATNQASDTADAGSERQGEGQQTNGQEGNLLDTALQSGKKWIEDSGVLNSVNQLPQALKDFGTRTAARVGDLSTTQKVVGGTLLAVGLGWLATRKGKSSGSKSAPYNYGKANKDGGSYGRRSYGYQAPDASTSGRFGTSGSGRSDSGSPYGNSGSRYGGSGSGSSYDSGSSYKSGASQGTGSSTSANSGSSLSDSSSGSGFGSSANTDHGSRTSESSYRSKNDDFRSVE